MALTKVTYVDNQTVIEASNLNAIQNELIRAAAYGACSTAAATAAKTVAVSGFVLETGAKVSVKFTYANTASSPTLNVNSTGAKSIMRNGTTNAASGDWKAGEVVDFVYDGSYWQMVGKAGNVANLSYTVISEF